MECPISYMFSLNRKIVSSLSLLSWKHSTESQKIVIFSSTPLNTESRLIMSVPLCLVFNSFLMATGVFIPWKGLAVKTMCTFLWFFWGLLSLFYGWAHVLPGAALG